MAKVARLAGLHQAAREAWAAVTLRTGAAAEAAASAAVLTRQHPPREEGWRLLALSLRACGRQADALAALRQARQVLRDELGLDPGPALADLKEAILGQRQEVLDRAASVPVLPAERPVRPTAPPSPEPAPGEADVFAGRDAELRAITDAAARSRRHGGVVPITAEPGGGKTALLGQAAGRLVAAAGWCRRGTARTPGAPPAFAWVEVLRALDGHGPVPDGSGDVRALASGGDVLPGADPGDAPAARFRLHRAVTAWLRDAAGAQPVAILFDDAQRRCRDPRPAAGQ